MTNKVDDAPQNNDTGKLVLIPGKINEMYCRTGVNPESVARKISKPNPFAVAVKENTQQRLRGPFANMCTFSKIGSKRKNSSVCPK